MNEFYNIIAAISGLLAGVFTGFLVLKPSKKHSHVYYENKITAMVEKNRNESEDIKEKSKKRASEALQYILEFEKKNKTQREKLEKLILSREEQLNQKNAKLQNMRAEIDQEVELSKLLRAKIQDLKGEIGRKLIDKSRISVSNAKSEILTVLQHDLELERDDHLVKYLEYLEEEKERLAKDLISNVIQRYYAPTSVEKRSSTITVDRDEYKYRIIGKNAEILLLLEELTEADIIFNDSPDTIIISCFELVKRHIAHETILKLLKEQDVTPEMVRQKLAETKVATEKSLIKTGKETIKMLELEHRNFPDEFLKIIGRLKFRTSYGQNILKHSFEVGYFTLMLGGELGLNMTTAKIGGFFHDLGKAIDQEVGGSHDVLTKEIMEKYSFPEEEIHAAWAHHDAVPQRTAEAMLVKAGDAISAGRPGARQESIEKYLERIQAIQDIGNSHEGVAKTYAISAGRELRVIVDPQRLGDEGLQPLANNVAGEIQANVAYPGKIKINVIRRVKNIDYTQVKRGHVQRVRPGIANSP